MHDFTLSVNFVQFICFVNVFWPLAKCHEKRHRGALHKRAAFQERPRGGKNSLRADDEMIDCPEEIARINNE